MSLRYLLDTNVISEPLRSQPHPTVLARLKQNQGLIALASIVWHELLYGCYHLPHSAKRTAIEYYLHQVVAPTIPILAYEERAAVWHADERVRLVQLGRTPPFADGQIAAVAHTNQLVLVTMNISDYAIFQGLIVEDWRL